MSKLLLKEMKLSASIISYFFIAFGLMFFLPGYPILCGAFFVTLGIFQSFQSVRETNDILFSALLPVAKADVVKGKYVFVCFIEVCAAALMSIVMLLRMTVFSEAGVYRSNALMNANPFALGLALVIFGVFNIVFVGGFFKTAYKIAKPFICHIVLTFLIIIIGETLHHIPGFEPLNAFGFEYPALQIFLLCLGMIIYIGLTLVAVKRAERTFEHVDL